MATGYPCYFELVVTGDLRSPSSLSLEKGSCHFPLQILMAAVAHFRVRVVLCGCVVLCSREGVLAEYQNGARASVQDGRDDNDDAGDVQAK